MEKHWQGLLHASEHRWHQHYGREAWASLGSFVSADWQFREHLQCMLRAALHTRGAPPHIRMTLVGGSFAMGRATSGPEVTWANQVRMWLTDALRSVNGSVTLQNAAAGAIDSAVATVCLHDQIGTGDADLFFWDFCANDGFTARNDSSVEDLLLQAIARSQAKRPSVFLVCSPSNGWIDGMPEYQVGHLVRSVARHYHAAFLDVANAVDPFAAAARRLVRCRQAQDGAGDCTAAGDTELPHWLSAPVGGDNWHAGASVHRIVSDLVTQLLIGALGSLGDATSSDARACTYPGYPFSRVFSGTRGFGLHLSCLSSLWCNHYCDGRLTGGNCRPMPLDLASGVTAAPHACTREAMRNRCVAMDAPAIADDAQSPRLCFELPRDQRIGQHGIIVYGGAEPGELRAKASTTWVDRVKDTRGVWNARTLVQDEVAYVRPEPLLWGHNQVVYIDGLSYGGAVGALSRRLCLSPRTPNTTTMLCGVWWVSRPIT